MKNLLTCQLLYIEYEQLEGFSCPILMLISIGVFCLTHCGLVTLYDIKNFGQHQLR